MKPAGLDQFENTLTVRPVPVDLAAEFRHAFTGDCKSLDQGRHPLFRDVAPGEEHDWFDRGLAARLSVGVESPEESFQQNRLASKSLFEKTPFVQA